MTEASAVLADNSSAHKAGEAVMLEEDEEEGEDEEGDEREGGLELDMWEGQFSLGGVGEGLGEGVWRQEEGVSCRRLAQEVWASQQEKEVAEQEAEDAFCNAVNFTAIQVTSLNSQHLSRFFSEDIWIFNQLSLFHMFPNPNPNLLRRCSNCRSRLASWPSLRQPPTTGENSVHAA